MAKRIAIAFLALAVLVLPSLMDGTLVEPTWVGEAEARGGGRGGGGRGGSRMGGSRGGRRGNKDKERKAERERDARENADALKRDAAGDAE